MGIRPWIAAGLALLLGASAGAMPPCQGAGWETRSIAVTSETARFLKDKLFADKLDPAGLTTPPIAEAATVAWAYWAGADSYRYSALGYCGPLGPFGPLGPKGPLGRFNPEKRPKGPISVPETIQFYARFFGGWVAGQFERAGEEQPLGAAGPLGPKGALGPPYCRLNGNDWLSLTSAKPTKHLMAGGVWASLGPVGPLGPAGPLGPLGPVGPVYNSHEVGGTRTGTIPGAYYLKSSGKREETIEVSFPGEGKRRYEWVEHYPGSVARDDGIPKDSSFIADGAFATGESRHDIRFTSRVSQFVTIAVIPGNPRDAYGLSALVAYPGPGAATRRVMAGTDWWQYVNTIHAYVPAGTSLDVEVTLTRRGTGTPPSCPWSWMSVGVDALTIGEDAFRGEYRLVVVGSTEAIDGTDITGVHQEAIR